MRRLHLSLGIIFAPRGPRIVRRGWHVRDRHGRFMPWPRVACERIAHNPWPFTFSRDAAFLTFALTATLLVACFTE